MGKVTDILVVEPFRDGHREEASPGELGGRCGKRKISRVGPETQKALRGDNRQSAIHCAFEVTESVCL